MAHGWVDRRRRTIKHLLAAGVRLVCTICHYSEMVGEGFGYGSRVKISLTARFCRDVPQLGRDSGNPLHKQPQVSLVANSRNQITTLNQTLRARPNQSGFCLCSLHQRHINTGPEKQQQHAQAGIRRQRRASNATLADRKMDMEPRP